jgi:hypothetical protein
MNRKLLLGIAVAIFAASGVALVTAGGVGSSGGVKEQDKGVGSSGGLKEQDKGVGSSGGVKEPTVVPPGRESHG